MSLRTLVIQGKTVAIVPIVQFFMFNETLKLQNYSHVNFLMWPDG